ncbi:MAG: hypothetical protein KU37_04520 [Sulfuricurvum sp. PC08-66]|nr:MAG: hypothetical protein KU37_04520 [Sulfuricurvum sp. PC08-66]
MKIQEAGPKPLISQAGVSLMQHHPDKYIYFQDIIALFDRVSNAKEGEHVVFETPKKKLSDAEIASWVSQHLKGIDALLTQELSKYKKKLDAQRENVEHNPALESQERMVWLKNLDEMYKYRVDRAQNKIIYWHIVDVLADLVLERKLIEFVLPYSTELFHVVEALANHLKAHKRFLSTHLIVKRCDDGRIFIYLILHDGTFVTC